jgi:hypothetical protein
MEVSNDLEKIKGLRSVTALASALEKDPWTSIQIDETELVRGDWGCY